MFIGLGFAVSAWSPDRREAGAETSPESSASDNPATSPVNFPPGRWIKVLSTQAEMESDPVNRGKLRDGVRFLDGWMDATACPETPSLQVTGLAGRNCGVRFRGKLGPDRKTWKTYTIMLRTGEPESESRSTYQFALAGLETTRPYLKASLYTFSSRRSDVLASSSDFPPLEPGDEFEMEFLVIGEKLIARYNGRDLLIPNDRRLSSGEVFIQNPQLIRNLEAINLDGLSDAEALNLVAAPGSSDPESGLSPPPPLSQ